MLSVKRIAVCSFSFLGKALLILWLSLTPLDAEAVDIECKFRGEKHIVFFKDLVSGENISYVGGKDDIVTKKEIYWGDDYVTIIIETTGMATLFVINTADLSATKRVTRAGISRGEARGLCRVLGQAKAK